jgi:hypothetical protein
MSKTLSLQTKAACANCLHFEDTPEAIEDAYPGLTAMSSGYASVRADDGLCRRHDLYLSAWDSCPSHELKAAVPTPKGTSSHLTDRHEALAVFYPSPAIENDTPSRPSARNRRLSQESDGNAKILAAVSSGPQETPAGDRKEPFWLVGLIGGIFH